ncbi:MAG: DUF58 domain-containing protein [Parafilimonas sp.]
MNNLVHPKTLMAIKDLSLAAKKTVDGFMSGINKSNVKGTGLEFSQYRSYQPGDDLRWLDWKMYARSDRYYIRESEMETSISVRFLIDASRSMLHEDSGISKMDYAKYLAAALAYLAHSQGDAIGLYVFKEGGLFSLASRKDAQHLTRFFYRLQHIQPEGKFTDAVHYRHIFTGGQKKELLVFITDMYEQDKEITKLLGALSSLGHDMTVFHLAGNNELKFDFGNYAAVQDLETGEKISINARETRKIYEERLQQYLSSVRMSLLDKHIFYRLVNMAEPLDKSLRDFLTQRQKSFI